MADVAEAIAAAMAAAAPPTSPHIKTEPSNTDAMILDPAPELSQSQAQAQAQSQSNSHSPMKRPRTPDDGGEQARDEKRPKIENDGVNEMDDLALLVQQAQAEAMQQFQLEPDKVDDLPSDHHELTNNIPHGMPDLETTLEPQAPSPIENAEPRPESLWSNPRDFTRRKHIIPMLGSLAIDVITAWSEQSLEDTVATLSGESDSDIAREYAVLKAAFDTQRKLLSDAHPLLYPEQLNVANQTREVIRVVNLATACASVFGTNELGLEEINEHFLRIFVPENHEVPRDAADLYLGLKTQIFLSVLETDPGKVKDQFLEDLFTTRLENALQEHHPNLLLTAAEYDFVASAKARKAMLLNESGDIDSIQALSKQFTYEAFLDSLSTFLNDHIESIRAQGTGKVETTVPVEETIQNDHMGEGLDETFDLNAMIAEASRAAQSALEPDGEVSNESHEPHEPHELDELSAFLAENVSKAVEQAKGNTELPSAIASAAESASRATMLALQSIQQNQYQPTALPQSTSPTQSASNHNNYQTQQTQQVQQSQQAQPQQQYYHYQQHQPSHGLPTYQTTNDHLPPNQSDSTPALYERARQAAAARSSTHARREGSHSTRRPWSPEEEKALMMGLDMVKGPHWSQILSLFGPNGSISNILADRTQVQLKDKARNLKLFFLKTNSEMPYYLQCVTGELKTRAPTQAARKEAEEKARLNSEEQQAHVNGILTLAGGLQNNATSRPSPSTTAPRSATPNQPLSHPNSQPGTPSLSQQHIPSSAPTPTPLSRPVIPAPQPVSLPTFTSSAHQHTSPPAPPPVSQFGQQAAPSTTVGTPSMTAPAEIPTTTAASMPATAPETAPIMENSEPEKSELSSVDQAVFNLRAVLEREGETDSAAASNHTTNTEEGGLPLTASATQETTSTQ
ncbi:telomere repeat binding factor-domain-containing protein [Jackrogersella minutella]|nr:telomere repeat binding factor-domain-containing protein [Jackrogersella minutella]